MTNQYMIQISNSTKLYLSLINNFSFKFNFFLINLYNFYKNGKYNYFFFLKNYNNF